MLSADVGIVGAGPGGLAAANALAAAGLAVTMLDEGHRAGGQIFRQLPPGAQRHGAIAEPPSHGHGERLFERFAHGGIDLQSGATVWRAQPGRLWFEQDGVSRRLDCRFLVLAPGAIDRCIPFPGWTLPGVVTPGALQVMVRGFGVVPGRRALVAGSGPLLLPTVTALLSAGVEVVAALEASSRRNALRAAPGILTNGARLREVLWYARKLFAAGVRLSWGQTVFAVEGDGKVERAIIGKVDRHGRPRRDTARTIEVDVVGAGFGLVPSAELGLLLGCESRFDAARGGHHLVVDDRQRTSVAGIWAAGEICGIGGAEVAMAEGELAAAAIVEHERGVAVPAAQMRHARRERRAADAMLRAFAPLPGLFELAQDDTIVCRCEDVPLGEARAAAALHGESMRAIKVGCRAGMGPCQARICGPSLMALACDRPALAMDRPVIQVPVKPVRSATIVDAPLD